MYGYRAFALLASRTLRDAYLRPAAGGTCRKDIPLEYPTGPAICTRGAESAHQAPASACGCGYYALRDPVDDLWTFGDIVAHVWGWGTVIEHALGWRAQYLQVIGFFPPRCHFWEDNLSCPASAAFYGFYGGIYPFERGWLRLGGVDLWPVALWCHTHAPNDSPPYRPIRPIKGLFRSLERYGPLYADDGVHRAEAVSVRL